MTRQKIESAEYSPERCNPDIKRLSYADNLSLSGHPKNSIVSEHECNRFAIIRAKHTHDKENIIVDEDGDLGPPGKEYCSRGMPLCMIAIDRIWDTRPSVKGTFAGWIISIAKQGNVIVPSVGGAPPLATADEANRPNILIRGINAIRGRSE